MTHSPKSLSSVFVAALVLGAVVVSASPAQADQRPLRYNVAAHFDSNGPPTFSGYVSHGAPLHRHGPACAHLAGHRTPTVYHRGVRPGFGRPYQVPRGYGWGPGHAPAPYYRGHPSRGWQPYRGDRGCGRR